MAEGKRRLTQGAACDLECLRRLETPGFVLWVDGWRGHLVRIWTITLAMAVFPVMMWGSYLPFVPKGLAVPQYLCKNISLGCLAIWAFFVLVILSSWLVRMLRDEEVIVSVDRRSGAIVVHGQPLGYVREHPVIIYEVSGSADGAAAKLYIHFAQKPNEPRVLICFAPPISSTSMWSWKNAVKFAESLGATATFTRRA